MKVSILCPSPLMPFYFPFKGNPVKSHSGLCHYPEFQSVLARLEDFASPGNTSYDLVSLGYAAVQDRVAIGMYGLVSSYKGSRQKFLVFRVGGLRGGLSLRTKPRDHVRRLRCRASQTSRHHRGGMRRAKSGRTCPHKTQDMSP